MTMNRSHALIAALLGATVWLTSLALIAATHDAQRHIAFGCCAVGAVLFSTALARWDTLGRHAHDVAGEYANRRRRPHGLARDLRPDRCPVGARRRRPCGLVPDGPPPPPDPYHGLAEEDMR